MKIELPNRNGQKGVEVIEANEPIVIVGANGSGKSRLGDWIARHTNSYRISAQKRLSLPLNDKWTLDRAMNDLKQTKNVEVGVLQNDYHILLQALFAEREKLAVEYLESSTKVAERLLPPVSFIDKLMSIWHDIFPYISITFDKNKVTAKTTNASYEGNHMSDGERVVFYLVGKCLVVPEPSILVIDEPELHLHRALMNRLWNKIEEAKTNCQFIICYS